MPLLSRAQPHSSRTFQELMEQHAARQAGFGEVIPLQRFVASTDEVDSLPSPPRRSNGSVSHPVTYPQPTTTPHRHPTRTAYSSTAPTASGVTHLPPSASFDRSRTSLSSSASESGTSSRTYPPSSSTASSGAAQPTTPTSSAQYPWTDDWGHPEYATSPLSQEVLPQKKEGGLKAWLRKRSTKDKDKGKEKAVDEVKPKDEKPVFIGGGRGGAQNRQVRAVKKPTSNLGPIPESQSPSSLAPYARSSHSSSGPLVTFSPDIQEALETLQSKPKPVFVGGGRGGMQNRKAKDTALGSAASGSWRSGSGKASGSGSDKSSSRRSVLSMGSSFVEGSVGSGVEGGAKPTKFVGGGRGGVQNRRPKDMAAGGIAKKKSQAGLGSADLLTGIGVSTYTVTSGVESVKSGR